MSQTHSQQRNQQDMCKWHRVNEVFQCNFNFALALWNESTLIGLRKKKFYLHSENWFDADLKSAFFSISFGCFAYFTSFHHTLSRVTLSLPFAIQQNNRRLFSFSPSLFALISASIWIFNRIEWKKTHRKKETSIFDPLRKIEWELVRCLLW